MIKPWEDAFLSHDRYLANSFESNFSSAFCPVKSNSRDYYLKHDTLVECLISETSGRLFKQLNLSRYWIIHEKKKTTEN